MKFGLSDTEYELLEKKLILPMTSMGIRLWIFGSRARGDHKKFSDIDVLYDLNDAKNLPVAFIATVKDHLEESTLPYKVDLVNLDELAESYKKSVLQDRQPLV